jgi:hypothetical protein
MTNGGQPGGLVELGLFRQLMCAYDVNLCLRVYGRHLLLLRA